MSLAPSRGTRRLKACLAYLLAIPLALVPAAPPAVAQQTQVQGAATPGPALSQAELEQMLAPIALYPDDLLVQVLVASTYPLELVLAARWLEAPGHKQLKGDALLQALNGENWDPSVKSLVPFPAVLKTMSDQLDWTQNLGDAFLAQQADVFAAVQALRSRASKAGTLTSTPQQTVVQEGAAIVIQPAQPETVYVPTYNPTVAYGTWPYPAYPPTYYPPPPGYYVGSALATGLAFGAGIAITGALWGWGNANWGGGNVNVNVNRFNQINANRQGNLVSRNQGAVSQRWQHNSAHRRGVAYSNDKLRQQYRGNAGGNAGGREAFRGRTGGVGGGGAGNLPALRPGGGAGRPSGLPQGPRSDGPRAGAGGGLGAGAGGLGQRGQGGPARPGAGGSTADLQNKLRAAQRPAGGRAGAGPQRPAQGGATRPSGGARGNFSGGAQRTPRQSTMQRPSSGGAAFRGMGNARGTRAASAQGRASRGGAARGGGYRRGGGGGRR